MALADFEALGIAFVSLKDTLDLSTLRGRFMFQIIAAFAELERAIIAERVRSGLQNAVRRGKKLGRSSNCRGQGQNSPFTRFRCLYTNDLGAAWHFPGHRS
jgi:DNA invertase Pin-like site-specific DNA recombinase